MHLSSVRMCCVCVDVRVLVSPLKINILPAAPDNDRAIFFGGCTRHRLWNEFRLKDKEDAFRLFGFVVLSGTFITSVSEIFSGKTEKESEAKKKSFLPANSDIFSSIRREMKQLFLEGKKYSKTVYSMTLKILSGLVCY